MTRPLNLLALLLAIASTAVAGYLTYTHYNQGALICGIGDCSLVQASQYAKIAGVPIAVLGLLASLALVALIIARSTLPDLADLANTAILAILVVGVVYTAYLTYLELFVIKAICQWCVTFATTTLLLLVVEGVRMKRDWDGDPALAYDED
jgi:uncharacterized membrane protein